MKKKVIIGIASILVVISGCLFAMFNSGNRSYEVITNETEKKKMNTNALTMMYETEAGSGEYTESSDNTWPLEGYVFNEELSRCENGSKLSWDNTTKRVMVEANVSEKCYVYFDVVVPPTLVEYITTEVYTGVDGENGLYYHDADLANGAQDNSYRYSGANPNNYVCFGSDATECPKENLYRIIGVFDNQVKLIRDFNYYEYSEWDVDGDNTWNEKVKPDIYTTLNETYYNSLETTWQNKIADATWKVGGLSSSHFKSSLKTNYDYEVGVYQTGYEETMKIGLMYVSDFVYSSSSNNWTVSLMDYGFASNPNEDWLPRSWTISRSLNDSGSVWVVTGAEGYLDGGHNASMDGDIYPTFYLKSSITYVSGSGTSDDPIIID